MPREPVRGREAPVEERAAVEVVVLGLVNTSESPTSDSAAARSWRRWGIELGLHDLLRDIGAPRTSSQVLDPPGPGVIAPAAGTAGQPVIRSSRA